jgi:hypothetical protein
MKPVCRFSLAVCSLLFLLAGTAGATEPVGSVDGARQEIPAPLVFQSFRAEYKVTRAVMRSEMTAAAAELRLELGADGGYRYSSSLRPVYVIALFYGDELAEYSRGRLDSAGVWPELYEMSLSGRKPREGGIVFDRDAGQVTQRFKGKEVLQSVPAQAHDRLSLHLMMARDLAAGKRAMQYLMVDQNRLRVYRFEVTGEEQINTPFGRHHTLRVELTGRLRLGNNARGLDVANARTDTDLTGEKQTTFWMAPSLGYLPLRLRHQDEDLGTFTMNIERLEMPLAERDQLQGAATGSALP